MPADEMPEDKAALEARLELLTQTLEDETGAGAVFLFLINPRCARGAVVGGCAGNGTLRQSVAVDILRDAVESLEGGHFTATIPSARAAPAGAQRGWAVPSAATRHWDTEIKSAANWLHRESRSAGVVIVLVDPPHMEPTTCEMAALQSGIAGSKALDPTRLANALRALADEVDLHAGQIRAHRGFESERTIDGEDAS